MPSRNRIKRNWAKHPRYLVKASDFHYMTVPQMSLVTGLRRVTDFDSTRSKNESGLGGR
jgi:hypothetical protein